ncbi:Cuticle protein [Homarus americanus]|uniref:Cuticle protein n=1 Tax=Homarus americanus TaxID=6706 RepID=A0A8J5JLD9_HOMAM|nr:Cuticle protein [Homarus americanus]
MYHAVRNPSEEDHVTVKTTSTKRNRKFPLPDGTVAEVRYVADENGYVADSPLIPTPPPLPAHAIEQIRIAEEQRAQGIVWDQYGFRVNRK